VISGADCCFGNLETPLIDNWSIKTKIFSGSSKWASGLAEAGFNVFHMAGNHMLDCGVQGFAQTIDAVRKQVYSLLVQEMISSRPDSL